jgi:hypothetical protein
MLTNPRPFGPTPSRYLPRRAETRVVWLSFGPNNLQLPEFTRSTTLWWTLLVVGLFAGFVVALLGFVYLKTKYDLTVRSDHLIASQMNIFAHLPPERRQDAIDQQLDPGDTQIAGWFGSDGRRDTHQGWDSVSIW